MHSQLFSEHGRGEKTICAPIVARIEELPIGLYIVPHRNPCYLAKMLLLFLMKWKRKIVKYSDFRIGGNDDDPQVRWKT
jgi:hypothetical protein